MSIKIFFLICLALTGVVRPGLAGNAVAAEKVIVYYFHGDARCPTCHRMEEYSREAVKSNFEGYVASGKLEFKMVNVENRGNEHYVNEYGLYTKSLVLSKVRDGKETGWKNLDKIWEYAGNKQRFVDYVTREIKEFQKGS